MAIIITAKGERILVDDADFENLSRHTWAVSGKKSKYALTSFPAGKNNPKQFKVRMHRLIMGIPLSDPRQVDHINGDGLDNRRENLRICTHAENTRNKRMLGANTSGFKGVSWHKGDRKFRAQITVNKRKIHLGNFDDAEMAHEMYCLAADMLHGEFANHGVNKK